MEKERTRMEKNQFGIPKADYFTENSNRYTGSLRGFHYCIDASGDTIRTVTWPGPQCLAKSTPTAEGEFSKDADGFNRAIAWLAEQAAQRWANLAAEKKPRPF